MPESTPAMCSKPPVLGHCKPLKNTWSYCSLRNICVQFKDNECGVGDNQFISRQKCEEACVEPLGPKNPMCFRITTTGSCKIKDLAWYYDTSDGFCKMFNHGDCGRGGNHFTTEQKCLEVCQPRDQKKLVCSLPQSPGICWFKLYRFYFVASKNTCLLIKGKSCGKNDNAFLSHGDCMKRCSHPNTPRPCYSSHYKNKQLHRDVLTKVANTSASDMGSLLASIYLSIGKPYMITANIGVQVCSKL
ncbi:papilin-like [Rhipicephalus sanguineus]|uniref:papilin-like n=1 Tax=Rhipicephalus sanguineus TaxID=34632 RepID=UPI0018935037|nr:papilin-like [Rhipicephalus sanguineus]